jgi:hypothetical protein
MRRRRAVLPEISAEELQDRARSVPAGHDGVHDQGSVVALEDVEQVQTHARGLERVHLARQQGAPPPGRQQTDGVVSQDVVAQAQHKDARRPVAGPIVRRRPAAQPIVTRNALWSRGEAPARSVLDRWERGRPVRRRKRSVP